MTNRLVSRRQQRGATLTGYALVMATFTSAALGTLATLEDTSGQYLTDTGEVIAEPLEGREYLATSILENPPEWATPRSTTTTTIATTTSTTSTTVASTASTTSTTAAPTYPSGTEYFNGPIDTSTSGMCLEVVGSQLKQQTCSSSAPPLKINTRPDGLSTISMADGTCLGTESASKSAKVKNQSCAETPNQLWTIVPSWNGTVQFKNSETGWCLDVSGNSTSSGADLIQWGDGNSPNGTCKPTNSNNNHNFNLDGPVGGGTTTTTVAPTTTTTVAPTTTTSTTAPAVLEVNASDAVLSGSMQRNNGYIYVPNGNGNNMSGPSGTNSSATFTFNVTTAGNYRIKGGVSAASGSDDSFYVTVDGQQTFYTWGVSRNNSTDYVNDRNGSDPDVVISLQPGSHTVTIHLREDGTRLSSLELEQQ